MLTVTCTVCGKQFEARRPHAKYCSYDCKRIASNAMHRQTEPIRKQRKENQARPQTLREFMAEVDASGMSYGEYVVWKNSLKP